MKQWISLLALVIFAMGCSDPTKGLVSGTVLVDGTPAETGAISFFPTDGKSPTSGGKITDGAYTVTAPVGTARVEIRVPKIVGKTKIYNTKDSPIQDVMVESLPTKYNDKSELIYDVPSGKSQKDFELATK